jgi:tetratricopeptide (TPR) repeat protein
LNNAIYENAVGNFDFALQTYQELDQTDPRVRFNIGWHLMRKGNFKEAFELLEEGSKCKREHGVMNIIHLENNKIEHKKRWHGNQTTRHFLLFLRGRHW